MNRRDLLKGAGLLALSLWQKPVLAQSASPKPLAVTFFGPFCFEKNAVNKTYTARAPHIGMKDFFWDRNMRHQPWIGTSTNE